MRMDKGKPFMDIPADYAPKDWPRDQKEPPTFSEAFLYATVGKGDARFILGVAEEYDHVVRALGPKALRLILDVKPRLAQRLGLPDVVIECLKDAESLDNEMRENRAPSQVILDEDAAHNLWQELHDEYRRFFVPEESMERDRLRAYNTLTEALGDWEKNERQKERDRLPEKLVAQEKRREELEKRKAIREDKTARIERVLRDFSSDGKIEERSIRSVAASVERELREEAA